VSIAAAVAVNCPGNFHKHVTAGRTVGVRRLRRRLRHAAGQAPHRRASPNRRLRQAVVVDQPWTCSRWHSLYRQPPKARAAKAPQKTRGYPPGDILSCWLVSTIDKHPARSVDISKKVDI
jgi:hypothetical protein